MEGLKMTKKPVYKKYDEQEIANKEHDDSLSVKKVQPYGWDGSNAVAIKVDSDGNVVVSTKESGLRIDDSVANTLYIGECAVGSTGSTSSAIWKIQKIDTSSINIKWADGNTSYDNIWDNRTSLTYS